MRFLAVLPILLFLAGCAITYKPSPFWGAGGYSSKDINANTVSVNFLAGRGGAMDTAKTFALYRCAEITLEKGFDWFRVKEGGVRSQSGGYGPHTSATYVIEMFRGTPPATQQHIGAEQVYSARALKALLEPKIVREGQPSPAAASEDPATKPSQLSQSTRIRMAVEGQGPRIVDPAVGRAEASPTNPPTQLPPGKADAINNVEAVPLVNERGRQGYREWLGKAFPRAFVIAENGSWNSTWGTSPRNASDPKDPAERAIAHCLRRGMKNCRLYAVDDRILWSQE